MDANNVQTVPTVDVGNIINESSHYHAFNKLTLSKVLELGEKGDINENAITITNSTPTDIEEIYEEMFECPIECPKCKSPWIYRHFNYCPHCGRPINWQI